MPPEISSCLHITHEAIEDLLLPKFALTRPLAELLCSVIIPAKDEAANLPASIAALAMQVDLQGRPLPPESYEVILLANNCQDDTVGVARRLGALYPNLVLHVAEITLPPATAHVGRARRLLMDEAAQRLISVGRTNGIIASTDADTCVSPTWLASIQAEVAAGADAVGGRILMMPDAACSTRRIHLRDTAYRLLAARLENVVDPDPADPWPRHHQHFGASLALTAAAYQRVGGLPEVRFLEDEALYQALRRHDLRVRHSPTVQVATSARQDGRAEVGLSWQLRQWAALGLRQEEPFVPSGQYLMHTWEIRRQLRVLWKAAHSARGTALLLPIQQYRQQIARILGIETIVLARKIRQSLTFGLLWEWVQQQQPLGQWPLVPLSQALAELRLLVREMQAQALSPENSAPSASSLLVRQV